MKKYLKAKNITEYMLQFKPSGKPDIELFKNQLKYLLRIYKLHEQEISKMMLYKTSDREETELNLPDYLWLTKGRIPKNEVKFNSIGIEHTKINPYKNEKWGDPLRNPNISFETKTKGIIGHNKKEEDLFAYRLNGISRNGVNKESLISEIKEAIKKKSNKKYRTKTNFLWIEIDTFLQFSLDGVTIANLSKNRDLITGIAYSINAEIMQSLKEEGFNYFEKFPIIIATFKLKSDASQGILSSSFSLSEKFGFDHGGIDFDKTDITIELFDKYNKAEILDENDDFENSLEIKMRD